jgi:hypothetical protein
VSPAEWERRLLAMHGATNADEFIEAVFRLLEATVTCLFALANLRNIDGLRLHGAFKKLKVTHRSQLVAKLR